MKNGRNRLIVFIITCVFVVSLVVVLAIMGFMIASSSSNILIVVNEAISKRTESILVGEELAEPEKYFTQKFILTDEYDEMLARYERFRVTKYDYKLELSSVWCWPGETEKTLTVKEYIGLVEGYMPKANMTEEEAALDMEITPPQWKNGIWTVKVKKEAGSWKIDSMEFVEEYKGPVNRHQHDGTPVIPSPSPSPSKLPTPTAEPSPSAAPTLRGRVDTGGDTLNIRSGPSTQNEIVTRVNDGEVIVILTRGDDTGWHEVQVGDKTGYCSSEFIDIVE